MILVEEDTNKNYHPQNGPVNEEAMLTYQLRLLENFTATCNHLDLTFSAIPTNSARQIYRTTFHRLKSDAKSCERRSN